MHLKKGVLFLFLSFLCCGCSRHGDNLPHVRIKSSDAYRLFAGLEADASIPAGVKGVEANGTFWQDYTVCCRFVADDETIYQILSSGYEKVTWSEIEQDMYPDESLQGFNPKWTPMEIKKRECYVRRVGEDHSIEVFRLVVDRQNGRVYAVGIGEMLPPVASSQGD
jgi:hypothetical protein